jgi:tetrahydromethanopterin S-methyltransferase subunit G
MKKIFFVFFLSFILLGGSFAFASDEVKTEDESKPSITIQFNNMEKLEEKFEKIEKDVEGDKVEINYEDAGGLGGLVGVAIFFGLLIAGICIAALVFWILMLIHAISKPIKSKALWILIILLFGILGAIVYYFAVKRDFDKMPKTEEAVKAEKVD